MTDTNLTILKSRVMSPRVGVIFGSTAALGCLLMICCSAVLFFGGEDLFGSPSLELAGSILGLLLMSVALYVYLSRRPVVTLSEKGGEPYLCIGPICYRGPFTCTVSISESTKSVAPRSFLNLDIYNAKWHHVCRFIEGAHFFRTLPDWPRGELLIKRRAGDIWTISGAKFVERAKEILDERLPHT